MLIPEEGRIPGKVLTEIVDMFRNGCIAETVMNKYGLNWHQVRPIKKIVKQVSEFDFKNEPEPVKEVVPVWMCITKEFHYDKEEDMFGLPSYSFDSLSPAEKEIFNSLE